MAQAQRSSNGSASQSLRRAADAETKKAVDERKRASDTSIKIAGVSKQIAGKQQSLEAALKNERAREEREQKGRQKRQDQEADRRRRAERKHVQEIARLARPEIRHVIMYPPEPEILRVLYLTSSPDHTAPLRVDAEVNNVLKAIRGAKYRDQVDLQVRPAASRQDLIDGINDLRPHVVHFSGHGVSGLLAFDNASLNDPQSVMIEFDLLAELLAATGTPPKLLVMNACSTLEGADVLLEAVPLVIAMADSVGDAGAGVFASQFYAAIASAQPVGAALRQAQAMMREALLREDANLPTLVNRNDIDPETVTLIVAP